MLNGSIVSMPVDIFAESGSLQPILTTNPTTTTIFVGVGDFNHFTIESRLMETVKSGSECSVSVVQLAPCSPTSTIVPTAGICSVVSSAVNIPTTESGAFLPVHSSSLSMNTVMFVKCSARSEGALFLSDSADLKLTATDLWTALPAQMEELSSTASQAMERTDSKQSVPLALQNSFEIATRASIHDLWAGVHHTLIRKLSCRVGASIFFDGTTDFDRLSLDSITFHNWNLVGLGSDLFLAEGIGVDADLQIGLGADLEVYTQISLVLLRVWFRVV
ncbi:hypothetical protein BLNAU_17634 [Blattamonas nauphoetae]|uniref:Uncharacterized protein n=1 Tax=Blattamonas nauphoetae TaxID=2049346 RepID=A0ABQ9X6P7_9EUKA|nr:hypothetical protein BLNAU_17634 [Blattamonas nauphoetae]